jgi:Xaa-Pro dipeptidase
MMPPQPRLAKLRAVMRAAGLDVVALIPGATMRWLGGGEHYLGERPIVVFIPLAEPPLAVLPQLEVPLFRATPLAPRIITWSDAEGYEPAFRAALAQLFTGGRVIGVEGLRMRFFEGELLRRLAPGASVVAADEPLGALRIVKEPAEVEALRQAVRISEEALRQTLDVVRPGMSEITLAGILEAHMRALGSEEPAFKTILHAGGNTALPHTGPLAYHAQAGDPLLIDFGAVYQGYRADITRTVFIGPPRPELRDFYGVVAAANAAARAAARPGASAGSVDEAARRVIIDAGFGPLLRHRTGHGLGLETHEPPYIVEGAAQLLEPGMVFTVEPGIYELGRIGVRIEDDLLVTAAGAESISTFERDILVVGG